MAIFTLTEYQQRIDSLRARMREREIDLAILSQNSDLYYYTGSIQPLYALIPVSGPALVLARKALRRIEEEVGHMKLEAFNSTKDLASILKKHNLHAVRNIGFTLDTITFASVQRWRQLFSEVKVSDLSWEIKSLRLVKSEAEINIQVKAGEIMSRLPEIVKTGFKPGMSELGLTAVIENYMRENGHTGLVRCRREGIEIGFGVCSAGVNSLAGTKFDGVCAGTGTTPAVPYGAGWGPIPKGVPVTLDYAFNFDGYHIDQTRMFCWGEPSAQFVRAYQAMLNIEEAVFALLRPGVSWEAPYRRSVQLAEENGYAAEFMGLGAEKVRFVGHGIGLELDEPPFIASKMEQVLEENMVIAIEPKVALPGVGVVGIEDTVVVKQSGCRILTSCPKEIIIL